MIYLNNLGIVCPLGDTHERIKQNLFNAKSGIITSEKYTPTALPLGETIFEEPSDLLPIEENSRNNRLALKALSQIKTDVDVMIERYGKERIAVVLGTSTSGGIEAEHAIKSLIDSNVFPSNYHYGQQELASLSQAIAHVLDIKGPVYLHSSACSSSAKAMASAARLLKMNICDAVITGGVDTLNAFVISGFLSLEAVSSDRCNPFSKNRKGINIGEAATLFLMSREPSAITLAGWGESSDGYHISAPDPTGNGAILSIKKALARAQITEHQIDYINLHGTGTIQNDAMESTVVHNLWGDNVLCSSTKPLTGHTLGTAGAIEAGFCWLAMQEDNPNGKVPPHLWDGHYDDKLPPIQLAQKGNQLGRPLRYCLSNSFAFGGANATLILGRS